MHSLTSMLRRVPLVAAAVVGVLAPCAAIAAARGDGVGPDRGIRVIDGDTLQIDGHVVQLYGIDAPELGQLCDRDGELWECGREAALYLQKQVNFGGPPIQCSPWGEEGNPGAGNDIVVAVCQVGPKAVGLTMVHNGYAVALPDSFPDYQEAEERAREARLGVWQSDFVLPWKWREGRGSEARTSDWVRQCPIKGVLGAAGEQIYYVPTDEEYAHVTVDPERSGQMFCSDDEARAAGWTRAGLTTQ